jgi:hypothetical protein
MCLSPTFQKASNVNCDVVEVDDKPNDNCVAVVNVVIVNEQRQNVSNIRKSLSMYDNVIPSVEIVTTDFLDVEKPQKSDDDRVADADISAAERRTSPSLNECRESASQ